MGGQYSALFRGRPTLVAVVILECCPPLAAAAAVAAAVAVPPVCSVEKYVCTALSLLLPYKYNIPFTRLSFFLIDDSRLFLFVAVPGRETPRSGVRGGGPLQLRGGSSDKHAWSAGSSYCNGRTTIPAGTNARYRFWVSTAVLKAAGRRRAREWCRISHLSSCGAC